MLSNETPKYGRWRQCPCSLAEQRLADLKAMLNEMRTERDAWREQAQRLSLPKPNEQLKTAWWRSAGAVGGMTALRRTLDYVELLGRVVIAVAVIAVALRLIGI